MPRTASKGRAGCPDGQFGHTCRIVFIVSVLTTGACLLATLSQRGGLLSQGSPGSLALPASADFVDVREASTDALFALKARVTTELQLRGGPVAERLRLQELATRTRGCPETSLTPATRTEMPRRAGSATVFCWMLVTPVAQELDLLRVHLCLNASLFRCDDHLLISNTSMRSLMAGVPHGDRIKELVVEQSLNTSYGGSWKTTLNTDLFVAVWKAIFAKGLHLQQDFTVKVDADSLFAPDRLFYVLDAYSKEEQRTAMYLNSCPWCLVKLIGPIEIFSREAMKQYSGNMDRCHREVPHHNISEDVFLENCGRLLRIRAVDPPRRLLRPDWKIQNIDHKFCSEGWAAFHPYKSPVALLRCYEITYALTETQVKAP